MSTASFCKMAWVTASCGVLACEKPLPKPQVFMPELETHSGHFFYGFEHSDFESKTTGERFWLQLGLKEEISKLFPEPTPRGPTGWRFQSVEMKVEGVAIRDGVFGHLGKYNHQFCVWRVIEIDRTGSDPPLDKVDLSDVTISEQYSPYYAMKCLDMLAPLAGLCLCDDAIDEKRTRVVPPETERHCVKYSDKTAVAAKKEELEAQEVAAKRAKATRHAGQRNLRRAYTLLRKDRLAQAKTMFSEIVESNVSTLLKIQATVGLSKVARAQGNPEESRSLVEKSLSEFPSDIAQQTWLIADLWCELAAAFATQGKVGNAKVALDAARESNPAVECVGAEPSLRRSRR